MRKIDNINISVIIPAFNAELFIEQTLQSVLHQTAPVDEIIIIDDGSTDNTQEIVIHIQSDNPHIILFTQQNKGASAARNLGIQKAKGDWILFLDADDLIAEDLIENYLDIINQNRCVAIYSNFIQINENNEEISSEFVGYELNSNDGFCKMFLRNPIISPSGCMVKKDVLNELNGFDENIKYVEDVDLWLRILDKGYSIGHLDKKLIYIRRHTSNTTSNIDITNAGEQFLINKFPISLLKKKLYKRNCILEDNHLDFINLLLRYNEWDEAKKLLDQLTINESYSRYVSFLFIKALVEIHFKHYIIAKELFKRILTINPNHGSTLNNLGVLCAMDLELDEAKKCFRKALSLFEGYIDATHNLKQLDDTNPTYRFTKRELRNSLLRYS